MSCKLTIEQICTMTESPLFDRKSARMRSSPAQSALISAKDSAVSSISSQERTGLLLVIICEINFCLFSSVCQR